MLFPFGRIDYIDSMLLTTTYYPQNDKPLLVAVHPYGIPSEIWMPLVNEINSYFSILLVDLPNHGKSRKEEGNWNLPALGAALAQTIRHYPNNDIILMGSSFGGWVASHALPHLSNVKGIALLNTPPLEQEPDFTLYYLPNESVGVLMNPESEKQAIRKAMEEICKHGDWQSDFDFASEGFIQSGLGLLFQCFGGIPKGLVFNERRILENLSFPIALISGAEEDYINNNYLQGLSFPSLWENKVHLIPGAKHYPMRQQVNACAELIKDFSEFCLIKK